MTEAGGGSLAEAAGTIALGDELQVCRLGFGARWLTKLAPDDGRALLRRVVELGVDFIDTADVYGATGSERMIAGVLHPYPDNLVIATKGGQTSVDGRPVPDGRPEHLRKACEGSLERLRLETIDLYQLHSADPAVPLEESLGALAELKTEGKIREIGGSNFYGENLERGLATVPLVSVQNEFSLARRHAEHALEACAERGMAFLPWCPLAMGSLAQGDGELARIAAGRGATPAQISLAWLLRHSPATVPIPGTASIAHLEENVAAASIRLDDGELERLEAAFPDAATP